MYKNKWVIVANGSECKVFEFENKSHKLNLINEFTAPEVRSHATNLGTERPGRVKESNNATRHAIEPKIDLQSKEKIKFSNKVTEYIEEEASKNKFDKLILIASPEFLGEIRKLLSKQIIPMISREINKDLVKFNEEEILSFLI